MENFIVIIKNFFKNLFIKFSTPKDIKTTRDYVYVKQWVKKTTSLYIAFTILAVLGIPFVYKLVPLFNIPKVLGYIITPPYVLITSWGYATLITYFPEIIKSVFKSGKTGYEIGEKFETKHIQVTHEYGNNYKVTSTTDHKGLLFAFLGGMMRFMIWAFFCVYIGPFLTFKKIIKSKENLKEYKS